MFERIDHIAIAVEDLDQAIRLYESLFELEVSHREFIDEYNVEVATVDLGGTAVELIEGRSDDSPIRRFVASRGAGLHHIAFVVDDIRKALEVLRAGGARLIDETPRRGKANSLVAFVHPKSTQGVLYELVELDSGHP